MSNDDYKIPDLIKKLIPTIDNYSYMYDYDCDYINQCPHPQESCLKGAKITPTARCGTSEIRQMLSNEENDKRSVIISGDYNQVNQQGDFSSSQMIQEITIEQVPLELISEFKELIKDETKMSSPKWIEFLKKLSLIGGTITTLIKLFEIIG